MPKELDPVIPDEATLNDSLERDVSKTLDLLDILPDLVRPSLDLLGLSPDPDELPLNITPETDTSVLPDGEFDLLSC